MKSKILLVFIAVLVFSCTSKINSDTYAEFKNKGELISQQTQGILLMNVGKAIQKGGAEYAVEFCNLNAGSLVDSLNAVYACEIQRVSPKNRNLGAALSSAQEKELWNLFVNEGLKDTLVQHKNSLVYYKPIKTAMPACLKCHGKPDENINQATQQKLRELYPKDLATGYLLNEYRGLWKIQFEHK